MIRKTLLIWLLLASVASADYLKVPVRTDTITTPNGKINEYSPCFTEPCDGEQPKIAWTGQIYGPRDAPTHYVVFTRDDATKITLPTTGAILTKGQAAVELGGKVSTGQLEKLPVRPSVIIRGAGVVLRWLWQWLQPALAWAVSGADNFNRADVSPIDGNWDDFYGATGNAWRLQIVGNVVDTVIGFGTAVYNGWAAPNDQYSQVKLADFSGADVRGGVILRGVVGTGFYACRGRSDGSQISYYDDVSFTTLAQEFSAVWVNNDVVKCDIVGANMDLRQNGTSVLTASDSNLTSGQPGMFLEQQTGTATLDDWQGGDVATAVSRRVRNKQGVVIQ